MGWIQWLVFILKGFLHKQELIPPFPQIKSLLSFFLVGTKPWASLWTTGTSATRLGSREPLPHKAEKMSWDALPTLGLAPRPTNSTHAGRQRAVPCLQAARGQLLLGLGVLYTENKDYWCCLQCIKPLTGPLHCKELHCPCWQHSVQTVARGLLCTSPGPQEGGQADS